MIGRGKDEKEELLESKHTRNSPSVACISVSVGITTEFVLFPRR